MAEAFNDNDSQKRGEEVKEAMDGRRGSKKEHWPVRLAGDDFLPPI